MWESGWSGGLHTRFDPNNTVLTTVKSNPPKRPGWCALYKNKNILHCGLLNIFKDILNCLILFVEGGSWSGSGVGDLN